MAEMIRLEHNNPDGENLVEIEISLGNTCNYACSYCPDELHSGSLGWIEKDHVKNFLDEVNYQYAGKTIIIQYTGGEPTVYPGFEELIQYGKQLGFQHSIISNGSRTLRFWEKFGPFFDKVHLTYHQEFADLDHFRQVVETVSQHTLVHVNFTMIPEIFEEIYTNASTLQKVDNVSITLKALRVDFGSKLYPYEEEQLTRMKAFRGAGPKTLPNHARGMMKKVYDDGTSEPKRPSQFVVDGDNQWKGWNCWVGIQQMCVKPNGDIYRGICRVGGKLGNIREVYDFPEEPVVCTKQHCSCVTDIMTRKERPAS